MTPDFEQEADLLIKAFNMASDGNPHKAWGLRTLIRNSLRAAYEKGKDEAFKEASCDDCYVIGFEACREAAARVAEECIGRADEFQDDGLDVAGLIGINIRALTPTNADKTEGKR